MSSVSIPQLLKLSKKRRVQIAETLWNSVLDQTEDVPAKHKVVLDDRLEALRSGRVKLISHAELMKKMRSKA